MEGQERLRAARVLVVGSGGLGSPVCYYLVSAGVGRVGIVDGDTVDRSNLQRQILHFTPDIGTPKVESARQKLEHLNPNVKIISYPVRLSRCNALDILGGWQVVVDATDNFETRFLIGDTCYFLKLPLVTGSVYQLEGQATVILPGEENPCYRCLYPEAPDESFAPPVSEAGVLGVVPGLIGLVQATEVIKLVTGKGRTLCRKLLYYDAFEMSFRLLKYRKKKDCPLCGERAVIKAPYK